MSKPVTDPARVLIVRLSHLGDVVTTLPLLHAVRARWPRALLGWAVERAFAPLLEGHPALDQVVAFDRGAPGARRRFARHLAGFRADLVIDAQGNAKSALWSRFARGARTIGLHRDDWQERWVAAFVPERAPRVGRERHAVERSTALARYVTGREVATSLELGLSLDERASGVERWRALGGARDAVLVHLSVQDDVRGWPTEHWLALVQELVRKGRTTIVLAGPAEAGVAETLRLALEQARCAPAGLWLGAKPLRHFAATLAAAADDGARLVSVDSGPMHVAAAVGLETRALLGPTDAARTGPWPLEARSVLRLEASQAPTCAPCVARRCTHPEGPICLARLGPARVLEALDRA